MWSVYFAAVLLFAQCKMKGGDSSKGASENHAQAPSGSVRFLRAGEGDVALLARSERARRLADARRLVVYVGATWCEPCQKFHHAIERGELDGTFPDLTLLEFDLDKDHERLDKAGYVSRYIPLFALPKEDGTASGKQIEGGIKGDGAVDFISAKLKAFLAQKE